MLNIVAGLLNGAGAPASTNSYESISTVTVGAGGASSISFSSIPSTYKHLQIRAISRADASAGSTSFNLLYLQFNSDTGTTYSEHRIEGNGASVSASAGANANQISASVESGSTQTSGVFGVSVIDVLEYANTNIYKTVRGLGGADNNGSGVVSLLSGNWRNTAAVTTITLKPQASNFAQYSSFALYGIKG